MTQQNDASGEVVNMADIEAETRDLMQQAARHDGMSISAWIGARMKDAAERSLSLPHLAQPNHAGASREEIAGDILPKSIGRLTLGDTLSDGERCCGGGDHDIAKGHPMYWPARLGEYDDSDPMCLAHAIEQAESDQGWWGTCDAAALSQYRPTDQGETAPETAGEECQHRAWKWADTGSSGTRECPDCGAKSERVGLWTTPAPPKSGHGGADVVTKDWRPIETAPRDGTILELVVDYSDGGGALHDATLAPTIGFNGFDNHGENEWKFAGWCWTHDHFTEGKGRVIAWRPSRLNTYAALSLSRPTDQMGDVRAYMKYWWDGDTIRWRVDLSDINEPWLEDLKPDVVPLYANPPTPEQVGGEMVAMREALEPFAAVADEYDDGEDDSFEVWMDAGPQRNIRSTFRLGMYRAARDALNASPDLPTEEQIARIIDPAAFSAVGCTILKDELGALADTIEIGSPRTQAVKKARSVLALVRSLPIESAKSAEDRG